MLKDTQLYFDLNPLIDCLSKVTWDEKNRCNLNTPNGNIFYDPHTICDEWKNTSIHQLLDSLPFQIGEARLMRLRPGTCYRAHADIDDRYHLNLTTNEQCYLIDLDNKEMHQLDSNGKMYLMDAGRIHTAVNYGSTDRVQLVIRKPLTRIVNDKFVTKTIKILNPSYNFRYVFDSKISNFLNQCNKNNELGFFNPKSETELELTLSEKTLEDLTNLLRTFHKEFIIS